MMKLIFIFLVSCCRISSYSALIPITDPVLFGTLKPGDHFDVLEQHKEEALNFFDPVRLQEYDDQRFYYHVSDIFFRYYQQARNQLNIPSDEPLPLDASCEAAEQADEFAKQILTKLNELIQHLPVLYTKQQNKKEHLDKEQSIPTPLLKGDLMMWQQCSNFLYYLDQALFWRNTHARFPQLYCTVLSEMVQYMIDCAPYLVCKTTKDPHSHNQITSMKHPEGMIWVDLYRKLHHLKMDLTTSDIGKQVTEIYECYKGPFYLSPVHDQGLLQSMERMFLEHLRAKYVERSVPLPAPADQTVMQPPAHIVIDVSGVPRASTSTPIKQTDPSTSTAEQGEPSTSTKQAKVPVVTEPTSWMTSTVIPPEMMFTPYADAAPVNVAEHFKNKTGDSKCLVCLDDMDPINLECALKQEEEIIEDIVEEAEVIEEDTEEVEDRPQEESDGCMSCFRTFLKMRQAPLPAQTETESQAGAQPEVVWAVSTEIVLFWRGSDPNGPKFSSTFPVIEPASICWCGGGEHHNCKMQIINPGRWKAQVCTSCQLHYGPIEKPLPKDQ